MQIGDVCVGNGEPLALISGLSVVESGAATLDCALAVQGVAERHGVPVVFKASFDKADRVSRHSYRGPGLDEGLRILVRVKQETGLPLMTDVHEAWQAKLVGEVADCLQIPAFLSHQTDLIAACAATGRAINVKKAPVDSPRDVGHSVEKCRSFGCENVMVTERGTSYGFDDQVVDFRSFALMRRFAPLGFDATDAVSPGDLASRAGRGGVAPLARAAVATGVDVLCVDVHPEPERAPCDTHCQLRLEGLDRLLGEIVAIAEAVPQ